MAFARSGLTPAQRLTINNERTKLLAAALDRASTGCVVVGLLAPVAAIGELSLSGGFAWGCVAFGLHVAAQTCIGRLR